MLARWRSAVFVSQIASSRLIRTSNVCTVEAMSRAADSRSQRWNLRVAAAEDELVREAAEISDSGLTGFVRSAAVSEAERVLADRQAFVVSDQDWRRFNEMLDRPARAPAGLRELFSKPSVFADE